MLRSNQLPETTQKHRSLSSGSMDTGLGQQQPGRQVQGQNHSVPKKYAKCHNKNPDGTSFMAIDKFSPHWRGSFIRQEISRMETWWIYNLKMCAQFGLNIKWEVNCFTNNS